MVERAAHYLLHGLRRDLFARKIRRDECQREELVVGHGIVVADVIGPLHDLAVDLLLFRMISAAQALLYRSVRTFFIGLWNIQK